MNGLIEQGINLFDQEDFAKAIEVFTQAIEADSNSTEAFYYRGRSYFKLKDYSHAEEDFKRGVELNADYAEAYAELSFAYMAQRNCAKAMDAVFHAMKLQPHSAYVLEKVGGFFYGCLSEYWTAAYYCSRAIEEDPNHAPAYSARGSMYHMAGNYERALQDYRKYIELKGDKAGPSILEYVKQLEALGGKDRISAPGFFRKLGHLYLQNGNYAQAAIEYTYHINHRPSSDSFSDRGAAYVLLGDYEKAFEDLNHALQLNANNVNAISNLGLAYSGVKKFKKAVEEFTRAIALDSKDATFYLNRGQAYRMLKKYKVAIADLSRAIQLDGRSGKAYAERGLSYGATGDTVKAMDDLVRGIELYPPQPQAHHALGTIYKAAGDKARALFHFEVSIKLMGKDADARTIALVDKLKKEVG